MRANWARAEGAGLAEIMRKQILHWSALGVAVTAIYFLRDKITDDGASLLTLLALALTTFLAGVHFDARMLVLGTLLGLAAVVGAFVPQLLWAIATPALIAGVVAIVWYRRRARS